MTQKQIRELFKAGVVLSGIACVGKDTLQLLVFHQATIVDALGKLIRGNFAHEKLSRMQSNDVGGADRGVAIVASKGPADRVPASDDISHVVRTPFYVIQSVKNRQLSTADNRKMGQIGSIETTKSALLFRGIETQTAKSGQGELTSLDRYLHRLVHIESGASLATRKKPAGR